MRETRKSKQGERNRGMAKGSRKGQGTIDNRYKRNRKKKKKAKQEEGTARRLSRGQRV